MPADLGAGARRVSPSLCVAGDRLEQAILPASSSHRCEVAARAMSGATFSLRLRAPLLPLLRPLQRLYGRSLGRNSSLDPGDGLALLVADRATRASCGPAQRTIDDRRGVISRRRRVGLQGADAGFQRLEAGQELGFGGSNTLHRDLHIRFRTPTPSTANASISATSECSLATSR